jgi:hypothetical protein
MTDAFFDEKLLLKLIVPLFGFISGQSLIANIPAAHLGSVSLCGKVNLKDFIISLNSNRAKYNSAILQNVKIPFVFYFCLLLFQPID